MPLTAGRWAHSRPPARDSVGLRTPPAHPALTSHAQRHEWRPGAEAGTDAPLCQDTCSGGLDAVLAHAEVCHNALVEFTSKEAFEASNDLARGPAIGGAACDVVAGWLVESHADDDGSLEGGVGLAVAAPIQAVPASGPPEEAGIGHAPQSFAKAASERMRVGLSMATENRTFMATENCTLLGRTSRAERTFSR